MTKKSPKRTPISRVRDPMSALAVWDNVLINGDTNLTAEEFKIVMYLTAHLDSRRTKNLEKFTFRTADFLNAIGLGGSNSHYFEKVMENLRSKTVTVENLVENSIAGMGWIDYYKIHRAAREHFVSLPELIFDQNVRDRWFSERELAKMSGTVEIRLGKELAPFLLSLKRNFTEIEIKHILSMKSIYAMRVYVLCKQFERTGERRMTIDIFRRQLGLGKKYPTWKDLKKDVLRPAEKEISVKTGLVVNITGESTVGREYDHLTFHIHTKPTATKLPSPKPTAGNPPKTWAERESAKNNIFLEIDRLDNQVMERVRQMWNTLSAEERNHYLSTAQADAFPAPGMTTEEQAQRLYLTEIRTASKDKAIRELTEQIDDLDRQKSLLG